MSDPTPEPPVPSPQPVDPTTDADLAAKVEQARQVRALWPWVAGPSRSQKVALVVITLLALGPIGALVVLLNSDPTPVRSVVEADTDQVTDTRVTVTIIGLAPSSGELRARVLVEPGTELLGGDGRLSTTIALVVNDARGSAERQFDKGTRPGPFEATLPVATGSIVRYPFDRYSGSIIIVLLEVGDDDPLPVAVSVRSIVDDFEVHGSWSEAADTGQGSLVVADWDAIRPATTTVYAVWLMILIWGLAATGALIVWAVVIWMVEVPFWAFGYFVGVLFALPPLRDSLPGRPPPGTIFDFVSFYWSVTLIGVGLILLLGIWLKRTRATVRLRDLDDAVHAPPGP